MPKPCCVQCKKSESLLWRTTEGGQICADCHKAKDCPGKEEDREKEPPVAVKEEDGGDAADAQPAPATAKGTRKSTRATRYKPKSGALAGGAGGSGGGGGPRGGARGRGRRSLFKRPPLKAPDAAATVLTSETVFYKGSYMQVGDIVSTVDVDGGVYYAQIRGFLTDQYCEKSAALTWLLPTKASPPPEACFDPATYIIGPEEDLPRKLSYMEFVMHAPSEYYRATGAPYPPLEREVPQSACNGFIWTALDPVTINPAPVFSS